MTTGLTNYESDEPRPLRVGSLGIVFVAAFLLILAAPALQQTLHVVPVRSLAADSEPVPFPRWRLRSLASGAYAAGVTAYYLNHLELRRPALHLYRAIMLGIFDTSPSDDVILGKDGWLFPNGRGGSYWGYYGLTPALTEEHLVRWQRTLTDRRDWLAARGIPYLVVIAPEAYEIYPEFMRDGVRPASVRSPLDQFVDHMAAHSDIVVLDLRPALRQAKSHGRLYYRTDPHWNQLGAYFGYLEIMRTLQHWFPNLQPTPLSDFRMVQNTARGGALARFIGEGDSRREEMIALAPRHPRLARGAMSTAHAAEAAAALGMTPEVLQKIYALTERPHAAIPRLVMWRDSYADALMPLLSEHFGRAVYLWTWRMVFDQETIVRERPDVVIQQVSSPIFLDDELPPTD